MSTSAPPTVNKAGDAPPGPSASTIVVSEASGYHVLKVEGYSRTKMMIATGDHVNSGEFHVGGHTWRINYYPSGNRSEFTDSISLFLEMTSAATAIDDVHAGLKLSLIDHAGEPVQSCSYVDKCTFTKKQHRRGFASFIKREDLEKSEHLKDDCFAVRCDLTVIIKELRVEEVVKVPPPVLQRHLGELLSGRDRTDVTFKVGKETFVAHRCILAARSSVFKAELFGSMKEYTARCIDIDDMEADVFRALLQFIYTDELPEMNKEEVAVMAQHLLVAADRYNMERLKMICEDKLYRHLDVSTAAITLALAEQHHCPRLKEAIFRFLNSPAKLRAVVTSDGYEHLTTSCPSITTELVAKIAALWT